MPVQVIIKRKLIIDKPQQIFPLLSELRSQAVQQTGYIDSMTLRNIDKPEEHMVISTWETLMTGKPGTRARNAEIFKAGWIL